MLLFGLLLIPVIFRPMAELIKRDMQMLFLQSAIDKMDDNLGRAAIIENGSPLFAGGTSSGESQIRRWMLENDLIEAIIALCKTADADGNIWV